MYSGDKIEEAEMAGAYGVYEGEKKCIYSCSIEICR
jgi:hypothetical protein